MRRASANTQGAARARDRRRIAEQLAPVVCPPVRPRRRGLRWWRASDRASRHAVQVASRSGANAAESAKPYSNAFPAEIRQAAEDLIGMLPEPVHRSDQFFVVTVSGETLLIPYRMYNPEPSSAAVRGEGPLARSIRLSLYSRHYDGFVRQRSLRGLLECNDSWVVPFVVQLIGEYVLEIVEDISQGLDLRPGTECRACYGRFVADNAAFVDRTSRRATSYWNCYYRFRYPVMRPEPGTKFELYPAFSLIALLRAAADDLGC